MKVAVALVKGASDARPAGTRDGGDHLLKRERDEADVVRGRIAGGVKEFGGVELCDSLSPPVESRRDEDELAAGGEPVPDHQIRHRVLAPELLEAGAAEDRPKWVDEETALDRRLVISGAVGGGRADHVLDKLHLD